MAKEPIVPSCFKAIPSDPPPGKKRIKNIYWDPDTKEVVLDVED